MRKEYDHFLFSDSGLHCFEYRIGTTALFEVLKLILPLKLSQDEGKILKGVGLVGVWAIRGFCERGT